MPTLLESVSSYLDGLPDGAADAVAGALDEFEEVGAEFRASLEQRESSREDQLYVATRLGPLAVVVAYAEGDREAWTVDAELYGCTGVVRLRSQYVERGLREDNAWIVRAEKPHVGIYGHRDEEKRRFAQACFQEMSRGH